MSAELTIAHYLSSLADRHEERPAVYFKSAFRTFSFSFRGVYERCLRVANHLAQKDIRRGDRVLIWSFNGQEYGSILLGCARPGGAVSADAIAGGLAAAGRAPDAGRRSRS